MPSRLQNGLSYTSYRYSPSAQQLGQYISLVGSNVVGSQNSIPMSDASFRAAGSYWSAVAVSSRGMIILSLGAYPACFLVLYTTAAHPSPLTRFKMSSDCPAGMLSRSRVTRSRPSTHPDLRLPPVKVPPTKPPTSFSSACWALVMQRYCSMVSVLRTGVFSFSTNSDHRMELFGQLVALRLPAVLILSFLLFCTVLLL